MCGNFANEDDMIAAVKKEFTKFLGKRGVLEYPDPARADEMAAEFVEIFGETHDIKTSENDNLTSLGEAILTEAFAVAGDLVPGDY